MSEILLAVFRKHEDNPRFEDIEDHGDLWAALHKCYNKASITDERVRVGFIFIIPILGFLTTAQVATVGLVIGYVLT